MSVLLPIATGRLHTEVSGVEVGLREHKIMLTLKVQTKIAADNIFIFYFYLSKKIRLDFSCESSASRGFT